MFVLINNVFLSFGEGSFFYSLGIRLDASTIETLNGLKGIGGNVYNGTLGIMSLMAPFFIGMALAEERKVDALAAGLLSVAAFMTVTPYSVGEAYAVGANWLGGANIISGIIIGLVVAEMFTFIVRRNWVIRLPDSVPASVSRSFSALIPGFIILSIMGIIAWALANYGSNFHQIIMDTISTPLASLGSVVGWAYVLFVPLLWFFGIHGSLALTALDSGIMTPVGAGKHRHLSAVWFRGCGAGSREDVSRLGETDARFLYFPRREWRDAGSDYRYLPGLASCGLPPGSKTGAAVRYLPD
ncbi:PTS system N,N'-diacetylchitobiose-specific transporter subunit IIC [Citrobacter koseri]|uniref:PTS system N,N'-diacetylchitobiose-specific transporter subunit IIC n=1 Tax=Citrobacter koseri TaxID=545 RepID=A0A2X2YN79_CITKO|nr:PTS system N,N'-diacetylchitobiose-specific transporter subunit IIC [Citrobacter koseri]